jgi:putative membrane protein
MTRHRKPAAFRLDDPDVVLAPVGEARSPAGAAAGGIVVTPAPEPAPPTPAAPAPPAPSRRRFPFATLFWSALGGLVLLALGLLGTKLVEGLFARAEWLGVLGAACAALTLAALLAILAREAIGLARLKNIEKLQVRAQAALDADDRQEARAIVRDLIAFERSEPRHARSRAMLASHVEEIIDGADLIRLAERELMGPLDEEARRSVAAAAKRVSVVTAISPRALVDMMFVLVNAVLLVRRLADLYGGRPGLLGLIRLFRHVVAHLALTGGMAAGDSLIQQVLGHGIAAKLSARLGEGVLNGLLTARLGLAAIEVARPLPFTALPRPLLTDLAPDLIGRRKSEVDAPPGEQAGS